MRSNGQKEIQSRTEHSKSSRIRNSYIFKNTKLRLAIIILLLNGLGAFKPGQEAG